VHRLQRGALPPLCKVAMMHGGVREKLLSPKNRIGLSQINALQVEKMKRLARGCFRLRAYFDRPARWMSDGRLESSFAVKAASSMTAPRLFNAR